MLYGGQNNVMTLYASLLNYIIGPINTTPNLKALDVIDGHGGKRLELLTV